MILMKYMFTIKDAGVKKSLESSWINANFVQVIEKIKLVEPKDAS